MSEERFDRIDQALERLEAGQSHVELRLDGIDLRLEGVDRRFDAVDRRIEDLDQHMRVLHEDALERIASAPDHTPRLEAKLDQVVVDLKEAMGRRLDPLEAAVRHHSVEIERLKHGRG
jgi:hypothetical protein